MTIRTFGLAIVVAGCVPALGQAQHVLLAGKTTIHGYPYGPRVAPSWTYPGLYGGPFVGYPLFPRYASPFVNYDPLGPNIGVYSGFGYGGLGYGYGYPGFGYGYGYPGFYRFPGRIGNQWTNGLSAYGPPVPVYGPIPGVFGNNDLVRNYRAAPGIAGYGWIGIYAASPRPRHPSVSARPTVERFGTTGFNAVPVAPVNSGGCLVLSVRVPQPTAEVTVDGRKTAQTGTDRIFESPPLEAGQTYKYTVTVRWLERGQTVESSREVTGVPGEVVRVDFGTGR